MNITQTMLDVCEEALYLLRQDVSLPTLANAPTDAGMEWVKCRKAFDYACAEVLAAHDWRFARSNASAKTSVDGWPDHIRKALVYCLARELAVQIAGRTEDLKNWHQLYNRFVIDARLKDLEEDVSADAVVKEVVATLRGYFSEESKDMPRSMLSIYERIGAVRDSSFKEVRAVHQWLSGAFIAGEANLPPLAMAAFVSLVEAKLAIACGLPTEAVTQLEEIYERKLVQARIVDLETTTVSDDVVKAVLGVVRPYFSTEQKNLPRSMADLIGRIATAREDALLEIKGSHHWSGGSVIKENSMPALAKEAWLTLVELKVAIACGLPAELTAQLENAYQDKLARARVVDLESTICTDAVAKEVLAAIRPYFSYDQKSFPLKMVDLYGRVDAVKASAFAEVKAAHDWKGLSSITDGDKLPPIARAAWIVLMEIKLGTACGVPHDAIAQWQEVYLTKLNQARVADLEGTLPSSGIEKTVLAAIRPYFSVDQKNLPRSISELTSRIEAAKDEALKEIKGAHQWLGGASVSASNLPPLAYEAWVTLVEVKVAAACGYAPEGIAQLQATYAERLQRARITDLETTVCSDAVTKEVLAAVRPFFSLDQKNLPLKMLDVYGRIDAVKAAAFEEVLAAHEWQGKSTITDGNKLPPIARAAWITLMEIRLGIACGVPKETLALWEEVYRDRLTRARVVDLEAIKSNDPVVQEVMAAILPFFSEDQKNLPRRKYDIFERVGAVKTAAFREVLAAHEWRGKSGMEDGDDLPPVAREAWIQRIEIDLGIACGVPQEAIALWQGVYLQKLVQARVIDLESSEATDSVTREVLAGIRPYFSTEQKNLPLTMLSLYDRIDDVRTSAFGEILASHNWQCRDAILGGETLPPHARAAWIALIQQKLAIACGLPVEAVTAFETIWRAKLRDAKVIDLETSPVPEGAVGEALTLVRGSYSSSETDLPMDVATLVERGKRMLPLAMREILAAHAWTFALEEERTLSQRLHEEGLGEYVWWTPVPMDCQRIVGVYGPDGELLEWERTADQVRAVGRIVRIQYVREVDDLDEFSPDAYRLVVLRLVADLAKTMTARKFMEHHENVYRDALAEAKLRDTRQSNPSAESVWGKNHHLEVMHGNLDPFGD